MAAKLHTLHRITRLLEQSGVDYVIGGSGMLYGLGLVDRVRDWDLMTDSPVSEVRAALDGLRLTEDSAPSELYGSGCKLRIEETEPEVEVIIGFSIRAEAGFCRLPARTGGICGGLRIASPTLWFAAYALMGRTEKAALLETYLMDRGAERSALSHLRGEPLPAELSERLNRLPSREV